MYSVLQIFRQGRTVRTAFAKSDFSSYIPIIFKRNVPVVVPKMLDFYFIFKLFLDFKMIGNQEVLQKIFTGGQT